MFVRTAELVNRARGAINDPAGRAQMTTAPMSLAKGLEFRAVVVLACDEGILPRDDRVADAAADEAELDDIYETERRLLYVACNRGREHLPLTGVKPASEYLRDFGAHANQLNVPRDRITNRCLPCPVEGSSACELGRLTCRRKFALESPLVFWENYQDPTSRVSLSVPNR